MKRVYSFVCLTVVVFLCLTACKSKDYEQAVSFQEAGEYESALEIFTTLDGYKDSTERIATCSDEIAKVEAFNAAVEQYNIAQAALYKKNEELDTAIASAENTVAEGFQVLDIDLIPALETVISEAKAVRKSIPAMPEETDAILSLIPDMKDMDYTSILERLALAKEAVEISIAQYALVNAPEEVYIIQRLEQVSGLTEIAAATEDNDPNEQLNKAGGYTAQVFFSYELVNQGSVPGSSIIEKGTDCGGSIEVYSCVEDAEKRNTYLSAFDGTIFASGSHTVIGTVIVRTSHKLTASQQKELEANIISALTSIDESK